MNILRHAVAHHPLVLTAIVACTAACGKDEPHVAQLDKSVHTPPPRPRADAGTTGSRAPGASGAEVRCESDHAALKPLWSKRKRDKEKADVSKGVEIGVDVAGAGKLGSPMGFFVDLCGNKYDCTVTTLQAPADGSVVIKRGANQRPEPLDRQWLPLRSKGAATKDTQTAAWIGAWLARAGGADVAVIWSDGMVDAANENEIVKAADLANLAGAWALVGLYDGAPCLLYVLARNDAVDFGFKVAEDLVMTQGKHLRLDLEKALELFPGTGWQGETSVTALAGADGFKRADSREVHVGDANGADTVVAVGDSYTAGWPTRITLGRLPSGSRKSRALGELAADLDKTMSLLPGVEFKLKASGAWPAALPQQAAALAANWSWAKLPREGDGVFDWGFDPGNNKTAQFAGRLPVVRACPSQAGGAFALGVHDALVARKTPDNSPAPHAGEQTNVSVTSVLTDRVVAKLLAAPKGGNCQAAILAVPTPKDAKILRTQAVPSTAMPSGKAIAAKAPYYPACGAAVATIDFEFEFTSTCREALLSYDVDKSTLAADIDRKLAACNTPLLQAFKALAAKSDGAAAAIAKQSGLTLKSIGKKVTRFYSWHLLHKFALALAKRSIDEFGAGGVSSDGRIRVPVVRVVIEPSPSPGK